MTVVIRSSDSAPVTPPTPSSTEGTAARQAGSESTSAPGAKASEQKEATESEPEATETEGAAQAEGAEGAGEGEAEGTEGTEGTDGGAEPKPEGEGAAEPEAGPKKKGGFQRRIDKLNAAKAAFQQEAEYWRREALKNATAPRDASKDASKDASQVEPAKAALAADKPKADDFETHAEFVEALTDWKVERARQADKAMAETARVQTENQKVMQAYGERAKAFAARQPDFQETLEGVDDVPMSVALQQEFLNSPHGPELAYRLAKDPAEFARIAKLPPMAVAREMGKLEARIALESASAKNPGTKKITQAPKPLSAMAGGNGTAAKSLSDPALSQSEYEAIRREQIKKRSQA